MLAIAASNGIYLHLHLRKKCTRIMKINVWRYEVDVAMKLLSLMNELIAGFFERRQSPDRFHHRVHNIRTVH